MNCCACYAHSIALVHVLKSQAASPAKVKELANVGLSLLPSTLGLRGGSEAWSEVCSQRCAEVQLGDLANGSDSICKPSAQEVMNPSGLLLVACKHLLLMLPHLVSFWGLDLAGDKSSLLTSNSPKISPSSSPDSMRNDSLGQWPYG